MDKVKNVPEIRFKGFDGKWLPVKLDDIGESIGGTSLEEEFNTYGSYKVISIGSYGKDSKYIDQGIRTILNNKTKSKLLNKNDLVMVLNDKTSSGDIIGRVLLIDEDDKYIYNQRSQRIIIDHKFVPMFVYQLLNSHKRNKIFHLAQGNTQIYVNWKTIKDIEYQMPSLKEQTQIGNFFKNLDEKLELEKEKHEKLVHFKKAMLEEMFPKEGENVPKIRFEGFDNEWEEEQLSEILLKYGSGGTPLKSKKEYYDGDIMFLNISDIGESKGIIYKTKRTITEEGLANSASWIVPKGSISLAMYASVGKVAILGRDIATSQAFFNMILKKEYNQYYIFTFLKKAELKNAWLKITETGSQPNLNASNVKSFIIEIPTLEEQTQIGKFFKNLDEKIELSEQKIMKIENFKKAMLHKMFV